MKEDNQQNEHVRAWAWVLDNGVSILTITRKIGYGTGVDMDDLHSETIERIVLKWNTYDENKSKPSTWIWWQGRAVLKKMIQQRRRQRNHCSVESRTNDLITPSGSEDFVYLRQIQQTATEKEWDACIARAEGYEGKELGDVLGCAPFSARRRVSRLLEKMKG